MDLRLEEKESIRRMMMGYCYYDDDHQSASCLENFSGGTMFCNTSNNQVGGSGDDTYHVVGAGTGSGSVLMSNSCSSSTTMFPLNSAGDQMVGGNLNMRMAFTAAQLQELEKQFVICKYLMSYKPVPHELIFPISRSSPRHRLCHYNSTIDLPILSSSSSNNNNSDAEPWRCRRTDGKKWRCSRDVAPDQKYCERHSHKSRPRSRKHVEQQQQQRLNKNDQIINHSLNKFVNSPTLLSSMASSDEQRRLDWFNNPTLEWNSTNSCINLVDQSLTMQDPHQYNSLLVSPKTQTQETRHFIDAWSMAADESNTGNETLQFSSLGLSMSGGSDTIDRNENAVMGSLGIMSGADGENVGTLRPHWLNHFSTPGGPLAEALCLGISTAATASSPHGGCSTTSTTTTSSRSSYGDFFGQLQ